MNVEPHSWYKKLFIVAAGLLALVAALCYLPDFVNYFTRKEIKSAYYSAAGKGLVPKPAEVPNAVSVGAMCGNGGIPNLVQVRISDAVTALFVAVRTSSSDWSFKREHASTNYSKTQLGE